MQSIKIARVRGIDIKLHPSFALVLVWVLIDWQRSGAEPRFIAFVLAFVLLLFVSVLLHEFGHAFMALHCGVPVHDITLSVIGGVARVGQLPLRGQTELLITGAGPLVSLAIVLLIAPWLLLFGVLAGYDDFSDYVLAAANPSFEGLVAGLLFANLMLFLFNLLPAFPMDGGRLLRASLSAVTNREIATRVAVGMGYCFAALLLVLSIVALHGVTLPLLAVFIVFTARSEWRAVRIESAMRRMRVAQFATWDHGGVTVDQPLVWALRDGVRDVVVVDDDNRVQGMLWRNNMLREISRGLNGKSVGDVMDPGPIATASADESVYDVQQRMDRLGLLAIPVVERDKYRGMLTVERLTHVHRQLSPVSSLMINWPRPGAWLEQLLRSFPR